MKKKDKKTRYSEEGAALLPAAISNIQVQKKNATRFSLFVENQFLIGVSEATLTHLNLKKGVVMTPSLLDEAEQAEERWAVREYFFRILSRRAHSRKELSDKAFRKGYSGDFISDILDEFEAKEYIDDEKFAYKYASDKFEFNEWGPYKIRTQLFKKGISRSIAEEIIQSTFGTQEIKESMISLIDKKKRYYQRQPEEKRRKKIFDFLMRKGYSTEHILKYMDELLELI